MRIFSLNQCSMNSSILRILELCFIITITGSAASLTSVDYEQLISDVYNIRKSSSLTLMHFSDDENLSQKNIILEIQLLLLRDKIMTSTINLEKVLKSTDERFNNLKRLRKNTSAMNVILLMSEGDVTKMQESTKFLSQNLIINLVLFVKTDESPSLEFCMNPDGNPFLLKEGISLLVKCYEDAAIREWHSINKKQMVISERATWEPKTGLILKSQKLVLTDDDVLNGKVLRSAIIKENENVREYFDNLSTALEMTGNFTIKKVKEEHSGTWNKSTKTWSGAIGLLEKGEVDLVTGWFPLSSDRLSVVDYSQPLVTFQTVLIIRQPKTKVLPSWYAYLKPFRVQAWITLVSSFVAIQAIRFFMKKKVPTDLDNGKFLGNDFFYACGACCQQGLPEFPKAPSLKIFYCTTFLFAFCVLGIYWGKLYSNLVIQELNLPFQTFEEFPKVKSHKLAIFQDSPLYNKFTNAKNSTWKEAGDLMLDKSKLPNSYQKAVDMICQDSVAFFAHDWFVPIAFNTTFNFCPMATINTDDFDSFAMIFHKNGPYTRAINRILTKFRIDGALKRMQSILYRGIVPVNQPDEMVLIVSAFDIKILLEILFGSAFLSITILFFENLYFWIYGIKIVSSPTLSRPL